MKLGNHSLSYSLSGLAQQTYAPLTLMSLVTPSMTLPSTLAETAHLSPALGYARFSSAAIVDSFLKLAPTPKMLV